MNTGCGERGRSGRGGAGRGRPQSTAPGATQTKASSRTQDPERAWPSAPSQDPEGGAQLQSRSLWPHAPCPAQPLLPSWVQGVRRCSGGQTAVLTVLSFPLVTH